MKGLILSGGKGTRLRPLTYTRAKQLLPLANKPVLFYAIEVLLAAGIKDIGIIVGDTAGEITQAVGTPLEYRARWGAEVSITFLPQEAPLGLAHAVLTAESFIGNDRFVMFLGDNVIGEALAPLVSEFAATDCPFQCRILLTAVENPSQFGVAEVEAIEVSQSAYQEALTPLKVIRLVEKPAVPPSNLALVGVYFFESSIFTAARAITPSARRELEITDAIQWLIDQHYSVHAQQLHGYWIDTGKMEDILDANRQILHDITPTIDPSAQIGNNVTLHGNVTVQAGAVIENSIVRGPAIIGERCVIRDAYIGPFTAIYHDTTITGSELEYSIVLEHCLIEGVQGRIEESLIGRYAEVRTATLKPRGHKLMLGDHSRVGI